MIHARPDYNARIQDSENKIPTDEPVMMFRGQDKLAVPTLNHYADLAELAGLHSIAASVRAHAALMEAYPVKKLPDVPEERPSEEIVLLDIIGRDHAKTINPTLSDATITIAAAVDKALKEQGDIVTGVTTQNGVDALFVSYASEAAPEDVHCYQVQGIEVSSC